MINRQIHCVTDFIQNIMIIAFLELIVLKIYVSSIKYHNNHINLRDFTIRSAIERINGRLDRDFMFENHTIRGLEKLILYVSMACLCIFGFAYLKVKKQETEHLSSWVA